MKLECIFFYKSTTSLNIFRLGEAVLPFCCHRLLSFYSTLPNNCTIAIPVRLLGSSKYVLTYSRFKYDWIQPSNVCQAIISKSSCSHQEVINKSSSRCQAVFSQLSGSCHDVAKYSCQAVVMQSLGSDQAVIRRSSGSHQAVIRLSSSKYCFFLFFDYPMRQNA